MEISRANDLELKFISDVNEAERAIETVYAESKQIALLIKPKPKSQRHLEMMNI